jgi:Na+/proline symporter
MALRDRKAMKQAQVIAIGWYSIVFIGMFFLGLAGHILQPEIGNPEDIFFALTGALFPPIIGAILLAAVLSAIMSTADSMLLVAASSVSYDLKLAEKYPGKELLISRLAIGVLCALAIVVAIYLPASIFQRVLFAWIAIGSAFGPLVFARILHWQVPPKAALYSIILGFGLAVVLYLLPNTPGDILERMLPFSVAFGLLAITRKKITNNVQQQI